MRNILAALAVLSIAGCAANPKSITADTVSSAGYAGQSCAVLSAQERSTQIKLDALSKAQSSARTGDIIGVILIGVPSSKLTGNDKGKEIARVKGELNTIRQVRSAKGC